MRYVSILVLAFLLFGNNANAQFLKKLKKKIEEKVENTVTNNIAEKAASETDKTLDNIWESSMNGNIPMGMNKADYSEIPESYKFSWKYDMKLEADGETTDLTYLFEEGASYLGTLINQKGSEMIIVFDPSENLSSMFINNEGSKMLMASKIAVNSEEVEELSEYDEMEITEIGKKEILGYDCTGYRMENEEYIVTSYITEETNLNFANMFQSQANPKIPKTVDADWFRKNSEGLMLEMEIVNKKKKNEKMKMYCTALSQKNLEIKKADYQKV